MSEQEHSTLLLILQQQTVLLQQLVSQQSKPLKATPAKRTTLRQQVHNDFKTQFYLKWQLSTNPSPHTSAKQ